MTRMPVAMPAMATEITGRSWPDDIGMKRTGRDNPKAFSFIINGLIPNNRWHSGALDGIYWRSCMGGGRTPGNLSPTGPTAFFGRLHLFRPLTRSYKHHWKDVLGPFICFTFNVDISFGSGEISIDVKRSRLGLV